MANSRICSIDDCTNPVHARGWCKAHYLRWHRYGYLERPRPSCSIPDCQARARSLGLCKKHYHRLVRHGSPFSFKFEKTTTIKNCSSLPEYQAWASMKHRCFNKNNREFHNYGGRGIVVCDRWLSNFDVFYSDMGPRPSPKHSIDRIDVNGNYEPSNCRWATNRQQANNKRYNRQISIGGITMTASQWCARFGISYSTYYSRVVAGMDERTALSKPVRPKAPNVGSSA